MKLLVVALVGIAVWLCVSVDAKAATYADQGQAYAACMVAIGNLTPGSGVTVSARGCRSGGSGTSAYYQGWWTFSDSNNTDVTVDQGTRYSYSTANSCSARSDSPGGSSSLFVGVSSSTGVCYQGCMYTMGSTATSYKLGASNKTVYTSAGLGVTSTVCSDVQTPSTDDQCAQDGTLTQCVKSDGSHCTTASNGVQVCWGAKESGVKLAPSGNDAATKSPDGATINAPRTTPANGGDWQVIGQSTTTITNNNTTTTYNNTSFQSSYGSSGNGSTSSGSDSGSGDGDGDDSGDDSGDYGSGAATGDLYTKSDKTVTGILDQFMVDAMDAPAVSAINDFMEVPSGGTCPVFSLPASKYWNAMTYDGHCSGDFFAFLQAAGYLILAIASYFAIRIAVN